MTADTTLTLADGRGFDLLAPCAADIVWPALAEQLAKENRFNGATPGVAYSVAEHLVRGTEAIMAMTGDAAVAAAFSLHDVPEAVLKDDTTPKKRALAALIARQCGVLAPAILDCFAAFDDLHQAAVNEAAGVPWPLPEAVAKEVKRFDLIMFVTEWRDLMRSGGRPWPHPNWAPYSGIQPLADTIVPWPWPEAQARLQRCWENLLPTAPRSRPPRDRIDGASDAELEADRRAFLNNNPLAQSAPDLSGSDHAHGKTRDKHAGTSE